MKLFGKNRETKYIQTRRNNKDIFNYNYNDIININRYYCDFNNRKK